MECELHINKTIIISRHSSNAFKARKTQFATRHEILFVNWSWRQRLTFKSFLGWANISLNNKFVQTGKHFGRLGKPEDWVSIKVGSRNKKLWVTYGQPKTLAIFVQRYTDWWKKIRRFRKHIKRKNEKNRLENRIHLHQILPRSNTAQKCNPHKITPYALRSSGF